MRLERSHERVEDGAAQERASGIMHQHLHRTTRRPNGGEPVAHRVLPRCATGRNTSNPPASKRSRECILLSVTNDDEHWQVAKGLNRACDHWHTAEKGELLGHVAAGTLSASSSNN
jgi:hypothetical protein